MDDGARVQLHLAAPDRLVVLALDVRLLDDVLGELHEGGVDGRTRV